MIPQLYVDVDGVLADFDGFYEKCFGVRPNQDTYEPPDFWENISNHGSFYEDQSPMVDAFILWEGLLRFHPNPVLLSGVPYSISIENIIEQKRKWVDTHLGTNIKLICCFSRDKCRYGKPGDVLIDDRVKYRKYWDDMGGVFIHHKNAENTLIQLRFVYGNLPVTGR